MREKSGYYWVRRIACNEWEIAEHIAEYWFCFGEEETFEDSDFSEIGDKIEIPEKYNR